MQIRDIIGQSIAKNIKGAYCAVAHPRVPRMKAPSVDQGQNGAQMVPTSSRIRERFFGCRFLSRNSWRNIRPGSTRATYCAPVAKLVNRVAKTAVVIIAWSLFACARIFLTMLCTIPVLSTIPANDSAMRIRAMVSSMEESPPRLTRRLMASTPVSMETPVYMAARISESPLPWKTAANTPPRAATPIRPGIAGALKATIRITQTGGISITGLMVKLSASVVM